MPRYIDANAVVEELRQIYNDCDDWENHISQSDLAESEKRILTNRASATKMAIIEVRMRVNEIPSADVVERKKGRWLNKGRRIVCSVCGRVNFSKPNFCDECGTDMREEKTDA